MIAYDQEKNVKTRKPTNRKKLKKKKKEKIRFCNSLKGTLTDPNYMYKNIYYFNLLQLQNVQRWSGIFY